MKINGRWCTIKFKTRSVKYWQNRLNLTLSLTLITIKYNNNLSRWYIIWRKICSTYCLKRPIFINTWFGEKLRKHFFWNSWLGQYLIFLSVQWVLVEIFHKVSKNLILSLIYQHCHPNRIQSMYMQVLQYHIFHIKHMFSIASI